MHVEKISFKPTVNLQMGFERSVIWGGEGHVPITIHSFLKSFFSFQNVSAAESFRETILEHVSAPLIFPTVCHLYGSG
jgi:capsule assembly protein Wzi